MAFRTLSRNAVQSASPHDGHDDNLEVNLCNAILPWYRGEMPSEPRQVTIQSALTMAALLLCAGFFLGRHIMQREYRRIERSRENAAVENIPLKWGSFDPKDLESLLNVGRPVLISIQDTTLKQIDLQYYLEYNIDGVANEEFRRFVFEHDVQLYSFECNWDRSAEERTLGDHAADAINELLHRQYPEMEPNVYLLPHFVLALPGNDRLIFFNDASVDANAIMAEILLNGASLQGTR